jgi:type IV pilus assembly protein PilA
MKIMRKKLNKRGFSLIELIVVIAILAIIAAVAIPRFAGIQARSEIKADATTAAEIISATRVMMSDNNMVDISQAEINALSFTADGDTLFEALASGGYMEVPEPQSDVGGVFAISLSAADAEATGVTGLTADTGMLYVTWTPDDASYDVLQGVVENVTFSLLED